MPSRLLCSPLLSAQMAVQSSLFKMFIVLGMYNFGLDLVSQKESNFHTYLWDTRLLQVDPMDGISLIGLPLLELEELDVLGLVELATEDEDLFCAEPTAGPPLIWCEGGGGAAKISKIPVRLLKKKRYGSFRISVIPNSSQHLPYPKGEKIGCQRQQYLQVKMH